MALPPDPARAKISSISYYTVPEPVPKTLKKHDLITIIIREESTITSDGTSDLKKNADMDANVSALPKLGNISGGNALSQNIAATMAGTRNFKGEAKVDRTDSFVTRIEAEVVDVKPNGTLAIAAHKRIKYDEEEQEYTMTGVCQAKDLTPDNTILSTQVHNLDISLTTKGAVRDTTKRGIVPQVLDFINPF